VRAVPAKKHSRDSALTRLAGCLPGPANDCCRIWPWFRREAVLLRPHAIVPASAHQKADDNQGTRAFVPRSLCLRLRHLRLAPDIGNADTQNETSGPCFEEFTLAEANSLGRSKLVRGRHRVNPSSHPAAYSERPRKSRRQRLTGAEVRRFDRMPGFGISGCVNLSKHPLAGNSNRRQVN